MKSKPTIGWLLPLVMVPFLTLLAWAAGVGKGHPKEPAPSTPRINTEVPGPMLAPSKLKTKRDYYNQAEKDSLLRDTTKAAPLMGSLPAAAQVASSLEKLTRTLGNQPSVPGPGPEVGFHPQVHPLQGLPLPPMVPGLPVSRPAPVPRPAPDPWPGSVPWSAPVPRPAPVRDTELDQYDRLLDKILEAQHPELPLRDRPKAPAQDQEDTLPATRATIDRDVSLISGQTIALRLEETLHAGGVQVDSGSLVYGTVSLQAERLHIQIRSILVGRKILKVHLEVYDQDGQPGLYVPGSLDRDVAKESTQESISTLNTDIVDPGLGAQAANAGIQAAKSLLSRKVRQEKVYVGSGYQVFIK
jgi:hypothetical protein